MECAITYMNKNQKDIKCANQKIVKRMLIPIIQIHLSYEGPNHKPPLRRKSCKSKARQKLALVK